MAYRCRRRKAEGAEGGPLGYAPTPSEKKIGKYFTGNCQVKFGHSVNFSYIYVRAKCLAAEVD